MKIYFASVETHALSLAQFIVQLFWKVITNENLYGDLVTRDKSKTIS